MNTDIAGCGVYISGVVGTWFGDGLASGARDHIREMELMRPDWPAYKAARQHARALIGGREVVFF